MYQFIVATRSSGTCVGTGNSSWSGAGATVGDISTMALAGNGTNKWASRAVVALQLAAWSAVGIVLLEKGVSSLQKSPHTPPLNVSQEITTPISPSNSPHSQLLSDQERIESLPENETDPLSVIPIDIDASTNPKSSLSEPENNPLPKSVDPMTSVGVDKPSTNPRQQLEQTDEKLSNRATSKSEESSRSKNSEEKNSDKKDIYVSKFTPPNFHNAEDKKEEEETKKEQDKETINGDKNLQEKSWTNPVTIKVIMDDFEDHRWENRKRLRVSRVNAGGGAAAAVAMVAVGAIMLILGPAVIILRALDERRQERRFLKLSGEEDLPPSYEEATSELDQAPTYSSLNLDTLLATSSPPTSNNSEDTCLTLNCRRGSCCCSRIVTQAFQTVH